MHAYLFIGNDEKLNEQVTKLAKSIDSTIYPMQLTSIKDTRTISSFSKLAQHKNVLILIENIQNASNDALQAFLKDLEEPKEHIFYALHATSEDFVIPTIRSRCQIEYLEKNDNQKDLSLIQKYMLATLDEKLEITDRIKDRGEAISFVDDLLTLQHKKLIVNPTKSLARCIETASKTRNSLTKNGNVFLHLSLMSILTS